MAKKGIKVDLAFFFAGGPEGSNCGAAFWHTCPICGTRFNDHGLPVTLCGIDTANGDTCGGPWIGELCGGCLTSSPQRLAELARARAPFVRVKRPRHGDDADENINLANDLVRGAEMLETLESIDNLSDGVFARKIGEAYWEIEGHPTPTGKAASLEVLRSCSTKDLKRRLALCNRAIE